MTKYFQKTISLITTISLVISSFWGINFGLVEAAFNPEINYQGKLFDSAGAPVTDGSYSIQFSLYTVASGGSNIWTETRSVTVTDGLFSVLLGDSTSLAGVNFDQALWLGVNVASDGEMTPRKQLGAVPAAFVADTLDGVDSTSFLRSDTDDEFESGNTLTFAGTFDSNGDLLIADTDIAFDGATTNFSTTGDFSINTNQVFVEQATGNVGIGTSSPDYGLHIVDTLTSSVDGIHATANVAATVSPSSNQGSGASNIAISGAASLSGSSTIGLAAGVQGLVIKNSTNTASSMYGLNGEVYNVSNTSTTSTGNRGKVAASGGTITNGVGVSGEVVSQGGAITTAKALNATVTNTSGTISTGYGVYVGSIAGSTNFGLYQSSASNKNYFAGNVGIGDTTPAALLTVGNGDLFRVTSTGNVSSTVSSGVAATFTNTGTGNSFVVNDQSSDTTPFVIDAGGNVGIGTSSPSYNLHVVGTANNTIVAQSSNTTGTSIVLNNTSVGGKAYEFYSTGSGNSAGAGLFGIYNVTDDKTQNSIDVAGNFYLRRDAQYIWGDNADYAGFGTIDAGIERDSAGVVGITDGTTGQGALRASNTYLAASGYINFGATTGSLGYGLRDNAGTLQFKNSGGSWANLGSGGGSGTVNSSTINNLPYYSGSTAISGASNITVDATDGRLTFDTTTNNAIEISTTSAIATTALRNSTPGAGGGAFALLGHSDGATFLSADDRIGGFLFTAYDGTGTTNGGGIVGYADGAWSASSAPTRFEFEVAPSGSTSRAAAFKIYNSGNLINYGTNKYLNWGTTEGLTGYGLRDNSGSIEYKDSGGSWTAFNTLGGGSSYWTQTGSDIYYTTGSVGIGTSSPSFALDVAGQAVLIGSDVGVAGSRTDATNKGAGVLAPHYTNAEESLLVIGASATSTTNNIIVGGGSPSNNAATSISFYTAANNTTTTGSNRLVIDSSGSVGINDTTPSYQLDVNGTGRFTGLLNLDAGASVTGDIIPTVDNTYSLGSPTFMWQDVYIGPGSLYINGKKVLEEDAGSIVVGADPNQNISVQTSGSGDVEINPTGTGNIQLKGNVVLTDGFNFTNSASNPIEFSDGVLAGNLSLSANTILATNTNGSIAITPDGTGSTYITNGSFGIGDSSPDHKLDVAGNIGLDASGYINWGDTDGTTGYGFRDNAGALEYKDSGGSWTAFNTLGGGGGGISNIVEDTTPQLGGQLDMNNFALGDGSLELLTFVETASAVNQLNITNNTTGNAPILGVAGDDTNIGLSLQAKGTGNITLGNFTFDADQTIGSGQDNYILTYDNSSGLVSLEAASGGGSAYSMLWAEENGDLNASTNSGYQFSFGNGATNAEGVTMGYSGQVSALTIKSANNASATVELYINGVATGDTVSLSSSNSATSTGLTTTFSAGDNITFRTTSVSGSTGATVVGATVVAGSLLDPNFDGGLQGSVVFADASGNLAQNNTEFYWNNSSNRLGIGTDSPGSKLQVQQSGNVKMLLTSSYSSNADDDVQFSMQLAQASGSQTPTDSFRITTSKLPGGSTWTGGTNNDAVVSFEALTDNSLIEVMTFYEGGDVGIGDSTPNHKLDVNGNIGLTASNYINWGDTTGTSGYGFRDNAGTLEYKDSGGSWSSIAGLSDKRLKNIKGNLKGSLDKVRQLQGLSYTWKDTNDYGTQTEIGFIAQEVQKVVPEVVRQSGEYLSISYGNLSALTVEAIKELDIKVDQQSVELAKLRASKESETVSIGGKVGATLDQVLASLGAVIENGRALFANVFTSKLTIVRGDNKDSVAGEGVIKSGENEVVIKNTEMRENAKVFVTMRGLAGEWYVSDQKDGEFTITLNGVAKQDINFDYFIVLVQGVNSLPNASVEDEQEYIGGKPVMKPVNTEEEVPTTEPVDETDPTVEAREEATVVEEEQVEEAVEQPNVENGTGGPEFDDSESQSNSELDQMINDSVDTRQDVANNPQESIINSSESNDTTEITNGESGTVTS